MSSNQNSTNSEVSLTYKFLLAFSTLSAVLFCWLYVTKPTTIVTSAQSDATQDSNIVSKTPDTAKSTALQGSSFDTLIQSSLPGDDKKRPSQVKASSLNSSIPVAQSISTASQVGWEETNDKIQHALIAQDSSTSERIIIEVPVIYQTRGLRFGAPQAKEASRILRALKIYQGQIKKLHQDGKNIQLAWDSLLASAQPISSLRADSPSLPDSQHSEKLPENSSATINITE